MVCILPFYVNIILDTGMSLILKSVWRVYINYFKSYERLNWLFSHLSVFFNQFKSCNAFIFEHPANLPSSSPPDLLENEANQSHSETSRYSCWRAITKMTKDIGGGSANHRSHCGKQHRGSSAAQRPVLSSSPTSGYMPKGKKAACARGTCTAHNSQEMGANSVPTNWWTDKEKVAVQTHVE